MLTCTYVYQCIKSVLRTATYLLLYMFIFKTINNNMLKFYESLNLCLHICKFMNR